MPVEFKLLRNDRLLVGEYSQELTIEDMDTALKKVDALLATTSLPVYNIADLSQTKKFPPKLMTVARNYRQQMANPKMGRIIVVTRSTFFTTMLNAILRVVPGINLKIVGTMEEAIAEIDKVLAAEASIKPT